MKVSKKRLTQIVTEELKESMSASIIKDKVGKRKTKKVIRESMGAPDNVKDAVVQGMKQMAKSITDDADKLYAFLEMVLELGQVEGGIPEDKLQEFANHFRGWIDDLKTFQDHSTEQIIKEEVKDKMEGQY